MLDAQFQVVRRGPRRRFTVDRANRSLVLIRRVIADVIIDYQQMLDLQEIVEAAGSCGQGEHVDRYREGLAATVQRLQRCLEELTELGVEIRDWGLGVVDFPAMADGREVYLCWQFGEPSVMYWHEADAGDAGRQSIDSLPPSAFLAAG
ncbi:MAG: DUF2203 family protein [Planctomycetota bacterium]